MELEGIIFTAISLFLTSILVFVSVLLVRQAERAEQVIAGRIGNDTYNMVVSFVHSMIEAANNHGKEQGWTGETKLDYVTDQVLRYMAFLESKGYRIPFEFDREQISDLIRGIYQETKLVFSEFVPGVD